MKYYYDKDLQDLLEKYLEAGDNGFSTTTKNKALNCKTKQ